MGFGHVGIHRRSISRILPGQAAGNAEVRTVALNRIQLEAAPSITTHGQSCSSRNVGNRVLEPASQWPNKDQGTAELLVQYRPKKRPGNHFGLCALIPDVIFMGRVA